MRPQIWFGPLDPSPPDPSRPFCGCADFFDLFPIEAPWKNAAEQTHVFKLYGGWVAWTATDEELREVVAGIRRRGMAIGYEGGQLTQTNECTGEIEGFAGPNEGLRIAERIRNAGGTIAFVDLEHGYDAARDPNIPEACQMSPVEIAKQTQLYVQAVRSIFPDALFGSVETGRHDVVQIETWVNAYRDVMGEELSHLHLDVDYEGRPDWEARALEIERYVHERGIEFGLFAIGDRDEESAEQWIATAENRMTSYEVEWGGSPDHWVFQTWHPQPSRTLPESDPGALTYLVNRYLRDRTTLTIAARGSESGGQTLEGHLVDGSGLPVAGKPVEIRAIPAEGPGLRAEYAFSGIVPEGATQADAGFRINIECACSGAAEITLFSIDYREGTEANNRVPNPVFEHGLEGWILWGDAAQDLGPTDQPGSQALHVSAPNLESAALNSAKFSVTAGSNFHVVFTARVSPGSSGSGYFTLIFDDGQQTQRRLQFPLRAARVFLGEARTGTEGDYRFDIPEDLPKGAAVRAEYAGNEQLWPSMTEPLVLITEEQGTTIP